LSDGVEKGQLAFHVIAPAGWADGPRPVRNREDSTVW
jgi:hypothetical protein